MDAITGVYTDRTEYSRYGLEPGDTRNVVTVYATVSGAVSGDTLTVTLTRLTGYTDALPQAILSSTVTLAANQPSVTTTLALEQAREYQPYDPPDGGPGANLIAPASRDNGIYRGVAGTYAIAATSGTLTAQSAPFTVTIVPSDELRGLWLNGVPLEALDVLAPVAQPALLTGVTIRRVGRAVWEDAYPLAWAPAASGLGGTLSWAGGSPVPVAGLAPQTLTLTGTGSAGFLTVAVTPWRLPPQAVTETIVIAGAAFSDAALQQYVTYATSQLESGWYWFVEPHTSDTDPLISQAPTEILQARGAVAANYHVEHQEVPQTYWRPRDFAHWMSFQLPRRQIQAVYYLYGYFNQSQAVSIGRDWIVFNPITGTLELVPDNGAVISWQFYGAAILQFFINYATIPSFWHFGLASGINDLHGEYGVIREAVAKRAAVDILSAAGFGYTAGATSRSVSRNGVSDTRAYAGDQGGGALRAQYLQWLDREVRRIGQRYGGLTMSFA